MSDISQKIKEAAPLLLAEIQKAGSILLHCHPSPDPDSVGSVLAMKSVLEAMGKRVTAIAGDSEIPQAFVHFPGAGGISKNNFFEMDLSTFDLFISLDSGNLEQVSRLRPLDQPLPVRTIVIDHHRTNPGYGSLNLVEPVYPAVGQILFELFEIWGVPITVDVAANLFMAIYADTGGFKYEGTSRRTFEVVAQLADIAPGFPKMISDMENSDTPQTITFRGLALSSIETFCNGKIALSAVPYGVIRDKGLVSGDVRVGDISGILRRVADWDVVGAMAEAEQGKVKLSFRTKNADLYDVSLLAAALGGGGHKAAAGAVLNMPLAEACDLVVTKARELYGL